MSLRFLALAILCCTAAPQTGLGEPPATRPSSGAPKNVIMMIADGSGYNMLQATRFWTGEPLAMDGPEWTTFAQATYALRRGRAFRRDLEPLAQDPGMLYDPARLYDPTPVPGEYRVKMFGQEIPYARGFAGYEMLRRSAPDSAATASALMSGVVTYNGAINMDGRRQPVESVGELAKRSGKAVGVVSSVPWTHATPAAAGAAHNVSRDRYHEISREMLDLGVADVLAGAGNPDYDDDGRPRTNPSYTYYAESDWQALKAGTRATNGGETWTLVQDTAEIQALAAGQTPPKLVIMPRVGPALQQMRARTGSGSADGAERGAFDTAPGEDPLTPGLPTLLDLARAGLNAVDDDPDGFFLMIEGGAVDWAMHDNQLGRAIEEYMEFNAAVKLVSDYLDAGTNGHTWENTLVIVTADHDHLLYGPEADKVPFQELEDRGKGTMPGYQWLFNSHSNSLVPLFARGPGSERLADLADETDAFEVGAHRFGRGPYLHQAEVGRLIKEFIAAGTPDDGATAAP